MYIGLTIIWAFLNTFALEVIAFIDIISIWWQVIGGLVIVIALCGTNYSTSFLCVHSLRNGNRVNWDKRQGVCSLSVLVSQYSLYGYDAAAHLTEETKVADKNGPIAVLSGIGSSQYLDGLIFWPSLSAFKILTIYMMFPMRLLELLYQHQYYVMHSMGGIITPLGPSFCCSSSGVPFSSAVSQSLQVQPEWYMHCQGIKEFPSHPYGGKVHPKHRVPSSAVWLFAAICILLGLPILKLNVALHCNHFQYIQLDGLVAMQFRSDARRIMAEKNFKAGPFYLRRARRPICLVAFLWICHTCSVCLLPTSYPIKWDSFNYLPIAVGVCLTLIMLWWILDARKWFKWPVRNIDSQNVKV